MQKKILDVKYSAPHKATKNITVMPTFFIVMILGQTPLI